MPKFKCEDCFETFESLEAALAHTRTNKTKDVEHVCIRWTPPLKDERELVKEAAQGSELMARYWAAIEFIALEDDAATEDLEEIVGYISTSLVASVWSKDRHEVARDVLDFRRVYSTAKQLIELRLADWASAEAPTPSYNQKKEMIYKLALAEFRAARRRQRREVLED